MNRILKVFVTKPEQEQLDKKLDILERYDAFVLTEASPAKAKEIARKHLVEDITDEYQIPVGMGTIDTSVPRVDAEGLTRPHSAYRRGSLFDQVNWSWPLDTPGTYPLPVVFTATSP